MKPEKTYTPEQLANADRAMAFLASLPDGQRSMVVTVASAFIAGMEAQTRLSAQERVTGDTAPAPAQAT